LHANEGLIMAGRSTTPETERITKEQQYLCLLCGSPLPIGGPSGWGIPQILCRRHEEHELLSAGCLGPWMESADGETPVEGIAERVQSRRLLAARYLPEPRTVVLSLDDGAALVFEYEIIGVSATYLPGSIVSGVGFSSLLEVSMKPPGESGILPVLSAIAAGHRVTGIEFWRDPRGEENPYVLALKFGAVAILTVEAVLSGELGSAMASDLQFFWQETAGTAC
jgi:hypothetical protein